MEKNEFKIKNNIPFLFYVWKNIDVVVGQCSSLTVKIGWGKKKKQQEKIKEKQFSFHTKVNNVLLYTKVVYIGL